MAEDKTMPNRVGTAGQLTAALLAVERLQQQIVNLEMASDRFRLDHYRDLYQLQTHLPNVQRALKRLTNTTT
jgi:hypothetical protein